MYAHTMGTNSMTEHEWGRQMALIVLVWMVVSVVAIILLLTVVRGFFT